MRLDVGCGNNPTGDVNTDLYVEDKFNHRNLCGGRLAVRDIANFVVCDARFLPFVGGCFDFVFCGQVIEHCDMPVKLFGELVRVSSYKVIVETVHRLGEGVFLLPKNRRWFKVHHVSKFDRRWLVGCARFFGCVVVYTWGALFDGVSSVDVGRLYGGGTPNFRSNSTVGFVYVFDSVLNSSSVSGLVSFVPRGFVNHVGFSYVCTFGVMPSVVFGVEEGGVTTYNVGLLSGDDAFVLSVLLGMSFAFLLFVLVYVRKR